MLELIIGIAVLGFIVHSIYRVSRWIRRIIKKLLNKNRPKADSQYCVLRILQCGELTHMTFDDEVKARESYKTALNFGEHENSFIALFERAIMIDSNMERGSSQ